MMFQNIAIITIVAILLTDIWPSLAFMSVTTGNLQVCARIIRQDAFFSIPSSIINKNSRLYDKWDDLVDEDEETPTWQGPPIPKDMRYIEFNLQRQNKHFAAIRAAGGSEVVNDIYARDPDSDTFWFAGKIARISDVSIEKAVARQYPLIEEHAARLRPLELFDKNGLLQLWAAPGDSEMDVAYNRPSVRFIKMGRDAEVEGANTVRNVEVGFQGEIYDGDEEGFRTQRTEDGLPVKPEIVSPEPPTN